MKPYTRLVPVERSSNPIDPGVDIGHVHMKATNLEKIHDFYVGILGFDVVAKMDTALFISAGGYHHDLAFNTWHSKDGKPAPLEASGLYHVAIRYPSRGALGDALIRLTQAQWPLEGVNDHGTHEALYLRDPDQNGIELYWDRPEEAWPVDENGHLAFAGSDIHIESLLNEGRRYAEAGR